jgi:hypothetical protein
MVGGKEGAVIRYVLNKPMKVDINIYDIAGRLIRRYKDIDSHEGINDGSNNDNLKWNGRWNGKTEGGDVVANGVYICELVAGDYRKYWRIVVLSMMRNRK